jgi:DNA-binding transcriptional LysR family regulator
MQRGNLDDLLAFLAVARERSFTKAAAKLGLSQSSLSHTIRELEARLGVRLLTRTTRSVAPTQAGERLLQNIGPRFEEIDAELAAVRDLREKPAGTIRITATEYAADAILLPKLAKLLPEYPEIKVEIIIEYGLSNIVAEGYDAGVRSGEQVAKDMIAVRIGPDLRMAVVGAPSYFRTRSEPATTASIYASRPTAGCTRGSLKKAAANSRCASKAKRPSTAPTRCSTPQSRDSVSPMCPKTWRSRISRKAASSGYSRTGASRTRAIICFIRAGVSRRRRSISWSMRCGTGPEKTRSYMRSSRPLHRRGVRSWSSYSWQFLSSCLQADRVSAGVSRTRPSPPALPRTRWASRRRMRDA